MIEFNGKSISKLKQAEKLSKLVDEVLLDEEEFIDCYRNSKQAVIFTNQRTLIFNLRAAKEKVLSYTAIPHKNVIVSDFMFLLNRDADGVIELFVANLGTIKFEIKGKSSVKLIARAISDCAATPTI